MAYAGGYATGYTDADTPAISVTSANATTADASLVVVAAASSLSAVSSPN